MNVSLLGLQPNTSILYKVIGRDYTGQAAAMAVADAFSEGLLNDFHVR